MPRYLIHIGPYKTGTTYLQHAFTQMRSELAARRVVYPDTWGGPHGHHTLAAAIAQDSDPSLSEVFAQLGRSDADTILLSSEDFAAFDDAAVRRLHALLAGEPATIVFYCRRWSELIPELWREAVRHGSLTTFPEFTLSCLADPFAAETLNFGHVLNRYTTVFGPRAVKLVSYNAVLEARMDLLAHFCQHFLNWPNPPPTDLDLADEALDMVDAEIIRSLNALEWIRAREDRERLYKPYLDAKPDLPVRFLVDQSMQYLVNTFHIDDAAPGLAQLHADLAGRYKAALVPPFPAGSLFKPRSAEISYIRQDYLFKEGILDALRTMQATLLQHVQKPEA